MSEHFIKLEEKRAAKEMRKYNQEMQTSNDVYEAKERFMFETKVLMKMYGENYFLFGTKSEANIAFLGLKTSPFIQRHINHSSNRSKNG